MTAPNGTPAPASPEVALRTLHRVWLSLLRRPWRSLAIVPADPAASARACAGALADVARLYALEPLEIREVAGAGTAEAEGVGAALAAARGRGARTVVGVDFPLENPSGLPLVIAADAVLLVVRYGSTDLPSARVLVDMIGRERIVGCVAFAR